MVCHSGFYSTAPELEEGFGLQSSEWTAFQGTAGCETPLVEVVESTSRRCVLRLTTRRMRREPVRVSDQIFEQLTIPGCGHVYAVGKPQLPVIRGLVEVPPDKTPVLRIRASSSFALEGVRVYPCQDSTRTSGMASESVEFQFNRTFYCTSTYYPTRLASIGSPMKLRGHTVVQVTVYPVRYKPSTNRCKSLNTLKSR
jgi:hypothetical protein